MGGAYLPRASGPTSMPPSADQLLGMTRRYFLGQASGLSLGAMALAARANESHPAEAGLSGLPHFAPRAKRVIFLTQSGGPSQIELFDHKPGLERWAGRDLPESVRMGQRLTTMTAQQRQLVMPSRARFRRYGQSGAP